MRNMIIGPTHGRKKAILHSFLHAFSLSSSLQHQLPRTFVSAIREGIDTTNAIKTGTNVVTREKGVTVSMITLSTTVHRE